MPHELWPVKCAAESESEGRYSNRSIEALSIRDIGGTLGASRDFLFDFLSEDFLVEAFDWMSF